MDIYKIYKIFKKKSFNFKIRRKNHKKNSKHILFCLLIQSNLFTFLIQC